jgi:site-specific recombinase XerD
MSRPSSKIAKVVVSGPLAPFAAPFEERLAELGYTPLTCVNELRLMAHLSRWLDTNRLAVGDLTKERIAEFLRERRAAGYTSGWSPRSLSPLVTTLEGLEALPAPPDPRPGSRIDVVVASFERYLIDERGLLPGTATAYTRRARRFLDGCADRDIAGLTPADVTAGVLREVATIGSVRSGQSFVAVLRGFLRFCFLDGLTPVDLSAATLNVTGRRPSLLPRGVTGAEVRALVASCDRRRSQGRRDYAVLLMLVRLGLRAGEVASLRLDDLDWQAGEVVVHGKGRRVDRLPLPVDVGDAIAGYLRRGRPVSASREVFLRTLAPVGPITSGAVSQIVRRACARAGTVPIGAHRLRHTLACDLVGAGAGLPEIAQLLRHRSLSSTAGYARVQVDQLRTLAQPWPGGEGQ